MLSLFTKKSEKQAINWYPFYAPRFWHGMPSFLWLRLLYRNGFQFSWTRLNIVLGVSTFCIFNDLLALLQEAVYGRRIRKMKIRDDPIFILGHWRSGTTLLHEMLVTNKKFAFANTFQCFAPWHFLLSEWLFVRFGQWLTPEKRPMDNMQAGWELPQEDEFALMVLGSPSSYLRIAFPQRDPPHINMLDMEHVTPQDLQRWQAALLWFVKALTFKYGRQLILKSPPHTGRIAELARLFPHAKFVHMTRDPRKLFSSTLKLWQSLDSVQALQGPSDPGKLREYVWECLDRMYAGYEKQCANIPAERLIEIRYEDLVANPVGTVEEIYEKLDLGDFQQALPQLQQRLEGHEEYRANHYQIDGKLEQEILSHWGHYANQYGYVQRVE